MLPSLLLGVLVLVVGQSLSSPVGRLHASEDLLEKALQQARAQQNPQQPPPSWILLPGATGKRGVDPTDNFWKRAGVSEDDVTAFWKRSGADDVAGDAFWKRSSPDSQVSEFWKRSPEGNGDADDAFWKRNSHETSMEKIMAALTTLQDFIEQRQNEHKAQGTGEKTRGYEVLDENTRAGEIEASAQKSVRGRRGENVQPEFNPTGW